MGLCLSTTKVSGSNSNTNTATTTNKHQNESTRPCTTTTTQQNPSSRHNTHSKPYESHRNRSSNQQRNSQQLQKGKGHSRRPSGVIPYGKRTDFGYAKDFGIKYSIGKLLGHGQFGYTFVATDKVNGDRVAVKRIEKVKMILPIAVEDVKREVKILQALTGHENVVQFHDAFEDEAYVYIVMELCEGGELLDRILSKKDSRYTEKDAAIIVRQMLKVAAECHLHGLVHRDMKPENFLFKSTKEDSALKATDFGLSDFIKRGKKFQDIVGSAYYVAPEVLKRKSGPESDVWSIGVITYILLCGRRPFWDKTEDGIFREVLKNKPDFRRKPWPSISSSAKDFIQKLLVKDPRTRFTAAQALSHPWVREGGDASEIPVDISVLSNMRQFVKYSRLKQFALRALASTLNEDELADLRDQFDAIDVDKNGSISLEEMRHALAKDLPWKMKEPCVLEILQATQELSHLLVPSWRRLNNWNNWRLRPRMRHRGCRKRWYHRWEGPVCVVYMVIDTGGAVGVPPVITVIGGAVDVVVNGSLVDETEWMIAGVVCNLIVVVGTSSTNVVIVIAATVEGFIGVSLSVTPDLIDSNTDGLVDFSEFVAATLHVHQMEEHDSDRWQMRSKSAFEKFDVDRDGFITPEELKMHAGLRGSIDPLLEEADIDKDGKISLSEFRRLLRTASLSSRNVPHSPSGFKNSRKQ
ncbi:hypothetical protein GIB67_022886 [Kingdonia uniflora]|uniref:non-specific serine/threonine protein kinase n=1 Tax=Kingdonia uniflora TaxID=39325 RepID=A0A7J7MWK9_9MAGN|nr:hypothetical protein GIB67_022886 [Kingdonia uniflora]